MILQDGVEYLDPVQDCENACILFEESRIALLTREIGEDRVRVVEVRRSSASLLGARL